MQNQDTERLLSSFGDHLLRNQLADSRHARYMVHWVRRYLVHPPPTPGATPGELMDSFLGLLRQEDMKEWQIDQARQSVTAWQAWGGGRNASAAPMPRVARTSPNASRHTRCATVSRHTFWSTAWISAKSRSCSGTRMSKPR